MSGYNDVTVTDASMSGYNDVIVTDGSMSGYNDVTVTDASMSGYNDVTVTDASTSGYNDVIVTLLPCLATTGRHCGCCFHVCLQNCVTVTAACNVFYYKVSILLSIAGRSVFRVRQHAVTIGN